MVEREAHIISGERKENEEISRGTTAALRANISFLFCHLFLPVLSRLPHGYQKRKEDKRLKLAGLSHLKYSL